MSSELQFKLKSTREKNNEDKKQSSRIISEALNIGGTIVLPIAGGTLLGVYLDSTFKTTPYITISCLILGVLSAFYSIIRLIRDIS
jgi:F0F1-type ATP synthase assembly protein I